MTTKLEKELKREIDVDGKHYTVTISPGGLKIAEKGHRKGHELTWKQILSSDPQLAQDLAKSVEQPPTAPQGSSWSANQGPFDTGSALHPGGVSRVDVVDPRHGGARLRGVRAGAGEARAARTS